MTERDPTEPLADVLADGGADYIELRYHGKRTRSVAVEQGRVDQAKMAEHSGVGVRVLAHGTWGFASTDRLEPAAVRRAVDAARRAAVSSAADRKHKIEALPPANLAVGRFDCDGYDELAARPLDQTLELVLAMEAQARESSPSITSAGCGYAEIFEEKGIVTSDGARAWTRIVRPEFRVSAVASKGGEIQRASESIGVTGAWDCLFGKQAAAAYAEQAAAGAVDLLSAGYPEGGRKRVLLSPALVGLLTHEAIGHTVEADFVASGSCAAGKLGQRVASELVTLCDSGASEHHPGAGGTLRVDDEGVLAGRTVIIQDGVLASYLHDRESAARFGVAPTGNARAWEYDDEPLIRMRNTYIEPGQSTLEQLIAGIDDGLMLDGPRNGQADANGEFMFGTARAWPIKNGKRGALMRGVNISGIAFDVLRSVDGVSGEFQWDLGSGHCGKGQPAKVDAGGPWLSCQVLVGGRNA
ncbi:MAG: TldD/PmbA family protein [Planctomycetota bacterium]|nr:MAG: TldD/PmbA family protein [Planctomycetota bacterium]